MHVPINDVRFLSGWVLFGSAVLVGTISFLFSTPLALTLFGVSLLHLGTCLHEIKDPDVGMLFRMGHLIGKLSAGWYLTIPHLWDIEAIPTSWMQVDMKGDMYTKQQTQISVKARVFYRVKQKELDKVLLLMPSEMEKRAEVIGLAVLRGEIGAHTFTELVSEKDTLEAAAEKRLLDEFGRYGYEFGDFEIYDFTEKVWSEAERVKALGKARGEAAKALAEPLKDNYPAAAVNAVTILADTAEKIVTTVWGGKKKENPKESSSSGKPTTGERLAKVIDNLVGEERS
ncbi:MAG: SPFH domain-containing protein [Candidatus Jorgensenbacteria bacterium]|nr:SPFH domain-containing protein [Candidatus Jorgensenbacteria bacterium]